MTPRLVVDDPVADRGAVLLRLDRSHDCSWVELETKEGTRHLRVRLVHEGSVVLEVDLGFGWADGSADPRGAVAACFFGASAPDLQHEVLRHLSVGAASLADIQAEDDHAALLVDAAHPALRDLRKQFPYSAVAALPEAMTSALRMGSFGRAVAELLGRPAGRSVVAAVGRAATAAGMLRVREMSMLPAMTALADDDVVFLFDDGVNTPSVMSVVSREAARASGAALESLGRLRHRRVLHDLFRRPSGLLALRRIASASRSGLDSSGLRGEGITDWLLERAAEALVMPIEGGPASTLHGARVGSSSTRLRVVRRKDEFAHIGARMSNCLGSVGPELVRRGSTILAVVAADGTPLQAIEVGPDDRIRQWFGPRNSIVVEDQATPIRELLASRGVSAAFDCFDVGPF